jgi:HSP20 family molecular chaperone IbpA
MEEPCPLELSEKLVYDNAGFFLRHEIEQWQPRYNLYEDDDKFRLVLELPGFKKGECETILRENAVIIKGTRADFNASLTDTIIHQSEIPSGSFKLHIPLRCDIDTHDATSIRDDGFILIKALKKKINEECLEI